MTADCAFRLGMPTEAEQFLTEAFRSNSTPENYFRILLESQDFYEVSAGTIPNLYKGVLRCKDVKAGYFSESS